MSVHAFSSLTSHLPFSNICRSLPVFIDVVSLVGAYIYTKVGMWYHVVWYQYFGWTLLCPSFGQRKWSQNNFLSWRQNQKVTAECWYLYVSCDFLCCLQAKLEFLKRLHGHLERDNVLKMSQITLQFCAAKGVEPPNATANFMPVLVHACPANFSTIEYFEVFIHLFACAECDTSCCSQELLPFLSVVYPFPPPNSTSYSSILPYFILPSISWSALRYAIYNWLICVKRDVNIILLEGTLSCIFLALWHWN